MKLKRFLVAIICIAALFAAGCSPADPGVSPMPSTAPTASVSPSEGKTAEPSKAPVPSGTVSPSESAVPTPGASVRPSAGVSPSPEEPVHKHELTQVKAKLATCLTEGHKAYYYCAGCGKYFSDKKGENEITLDSTVLPALGHKTSGDKKDLKHDENGHYFQCQNIGCTEKVDYAPHIFDDGVNLSETQAVYTCTECGYQKYGAAILAKVGGTISAAGEADLTKVVLALYNDAEVLTYENKVNASGAFELEAPIGKTYRLLAYSKEGFRGVSGEFATERGASAEASVSMAQGDMLGTLTLNGKSVVPSGKLTDTLIDGMLQSGVVDTEIASDELVWNGERRRYLMPLATKVKTGDFAFEPTLSSTMAYGYAGVGVTDGTGVLLVETSTYPGIDPGYTIVEFGTYSGGVYKLGFVMAVSAGGILSQQATNFKTTPSIRHRGDRFDLCMGDVLFATLDGEWLHMKDDYRMINSPFFLKNNYPEELASFLQTDNEYGFLYTSERGIAGSVRYEYRFADYGTLKGTLDCDEIYKNSLQDTRIVVKGENTYTFYNAIDGDGNFSLDLPYGTYDLLFSNPADLTATAMEVALGEAEVWLKAVTLKNKKLATSSVIVNGSEVKLGRDLGEYEDGVTMDLNADAEKLALFDNSVTRGEAKYTVSMNIAQGWGSAIGGITDGESAIRVLIRNGYINMIEFEYLLLTGDKTGWWVSNYRTYFLSGDMLPVYNNGTTSGELNFTFHKKTNGEIEVSLGETLLLTVKSAGFYVASGVSVGAGSQNFTVDENGRISDPAGFFGGPEANFVSLSREYAAFGGVITHTAASGGKVTFRSAVKPVKDEETVDEKAEALKEVLGGKYLSLLGDSITTFDGISNVTTNNSTLATGVDKACYPYYDVDKLEEIYWYQLLQSTGMNLLVNNSIGGSRAYGAEDDASAACNFRCVNLHADTGDLAGTDPDVILVYIGINDVGATDESVEQFKKGYGEMISKLKARYDKADIFVIDLPYPDNTEAYPREKFDECNAAIREIVAEAGLQLIRFSGSKADDGANLTCDRLHPNVYGMRAYYEVIRDALYDFYCKK